MTFIDFFKQSAKRFLKDYNSRSITNEGVVSYNPNYFKDIDRIVNQFNISEDKFTLMNAQHIIAKLAGFNKWNDLINASDEMLEMGKLMIQYREKYQKSIFCFHNIVDDWKNGEEKQLEKYDDKFKLNLFKYEVIDKLNQKGRTLKVDFTKHINGQDMIKTIMREKGLNEEEAIKYSITKENFDKVMTTEWAYIAVSYWGHDDPNREKEKLENPIINIRLTGAEYELLKIVKLSSRVTYRNAILYFMIFTLESLGYHI